MLNNHLIFPIIFLCGTLSNKLTIFFITNLLCHLINCIQCCVFGYFYIFQNIFNNCLVTMTILINHYINYLSYLTFRLTEYPTNIIFVIGLNSALYIIKLIISDILLKLTMIK